MIITPAEYFLTDSFCRHILGNIDDKEFMDERNETRSPKKVLKNNLKGKLAEISIFNLLSRYKLNPVMDFNIYDDKNIGDSGDIIVNHKVIDVKASSERAKNVLIECDRVKTWGLGATKPDYLCLVSIKKTIDGYEADYICGISTDEFLKESTLFHRDDFIPNTSCQLETDNHILHKSKCSIKVKDLINFIK